MSALGADALERGCGGCHRLDLVGDLAAEQLSAPADGAGQTSAIAGNTGLLSSQPELSCTLGVRGAYLLPLHHLQVALLCRYRDRGSDHRPLRVCASSVMCRGQGKLVTSAARRGVWPTRSQVR